jgi:mono/diheme cytochrome c family protein
MAFDRYLLIRQLWKGVKKFILQYCMTCHQIDGGGVPGMNPPLEKTPHVLGARQNL